MAMKQKNYEQRRDSSDGADDSLLNSTKTFGDGNTIESSICASSGSYDTTEDLTDTDNSSQKKSRPSRRKSGREKGKLDGRIQFVLKANILHEVESHENFSTKERGNYWWSDREKDRMMAKHERLVAKYEQQRSGTKPGTSKKPSVNKLGSYRGLESWTAAGSLKLDHTIELCISSVMDEQDRQWNENDDDSAVIARKSLAVTEDSARRARLNGLQDAQEALKIRGESWSNKCGGDEISVGSAVSTGTAAFARKKKRSKLLARLDDSNKLLKKSDHSDDEGILSSLNKKARKKKERKKKERKKRDRKKKEKGKVAGTNKSDDTTDNTNTTQPTSIVSQMDEQDKKSLDSAQISMPVSPLTSPTSTDNDVHPLLASLRREQEQLRQSSREPQEDAKISISHLQQSVDDGEDDIVKTLRRQQQKQALSWKTELRGDPSAGGNSGTPTYSGGPVAKVSSFREDHSTAGDSQPANMSDPPGRRPRRLASRHVGANLRVDDAIPEITRSRSDIKKKKRGSSFSDTSSSPIVLPPAHDLSDFDESKGRSRFSQSPLGSKKSLNLIRNGAKTLFKKGMKK